MEELIKRWGGELVVTKFDAISEAWIVIAVHSTRLGPATGGTRMRTYSSLEAAVGDALRLSESMSWKFAAANFPRGGGKAVIAIPSDFATSNKAPLLRRYGGLLVQLGGLFRTGPDMGTSPADMDVVAETAPDYVHSRTPQAGGAGDSGPLTARGAYSGIQTLCAFLDGQPSLAGRTVALQGAGSVGRPLVKLLVEGGATVLVSDSDPDALGPLKLSRVEIVSPEVIYDTECDIFAPCAAGGVLNDSTIPRLRCRAIAGAANNQLGSPDDAGRLHERGILYVPDFILNIGGAMGITGMEAMGWSLSQAEERVTQAVATTVSEALEQSRREGITPLDATSRLVQQRLRAAES